MQASLPQLLEVTPPRELSGSATAGRYQYQANYGILKLIELLESGNDFRIVFDLFDDVMVLDSATAPARVWFYQVKTKDPGHWTSSDLCKLVGAKAPRSIVSRMCDHLSRFGAAVAETCMVSNAPYRLQLLDESHTSGSHARIMGPELNSKEIDKISSAVEEDDPSADVPAWLPKLAFIRTTLGVHDQDIFVIGRLQKHFDKAYGGEGTKITPLYQTLHESIAHKTSFSEIGIDQSEVLARKSLTKDELEQLLARAAQGRHSFIEDWETIRADLESIGIKSLTQVRIKTAAVAYYRDRSAGRPDASRLAEFVGRWVLDNAPAIAKCDSITKLAAMMEAALPESFGYSNTALQAALIVEAYEAGT